MSWSGREITDATPDAQAAVDFVWERLEEIGLTNGKRKPPVEIVHEDPRRRHDAERLLPGRGGVPPP